MSLLQSKFSKIECTPESTSKNVQNRIIIDWLRVTFDEDSWGFVCSLFDENPSADNWVTTNFFRKDFLTMPMDGVMLAAESIPYLNDEGEYCIEGRFILNFSGNGLGVYFAKRPDIFIGDFIARCASEKGAVVRRLDVAFDDFGRNLDILKMRMLCKEKEPKSRVVSRWRSARFYESFVMGGGGDEGLTLYIGAPSSDSYVRVYDKRQEVIASAKKRKVEIDLSLVPVSWIRLELQLGGKKADAVVHEFMSSEFGFSPKFFTGLLRGLIEFKQGLRNGRKKDDLRAARWWTKFLGMKTKFPVCAPKPRATIETKEAWVNHAVAPTLALLLEHNDGDMKFIEDLVSDGARRLTVKHRALLSTIDHGE